MSRARNCIEDAFGILCGRWRILHTKLCFNLETSSDIVRACVCLHNFLLTYDLAVNEEKRRYCVIEQDVLAYDMPNEIDDDIIIPENVIRQREILMEYLNSRPGAIPDQ